MLDVLVVFGTRPELLKLAPVVLALRKFGLRVGVVATGQHSDLLDGETLKRLGPVQSLGVASDGSVVKFTAKAERALKAHIASVAPRCVLVQGDTMSAYAGALAAAAYDIPVAHVEAGLRSGDVADPWPEEGIRVAITQLATWHYAPTTTAAMHVAAERGGRKARGAEVLVTGNTSVDALLATGVKPSAEAGAAVLITLHRRELRERADIGDVLEALAQAVALTPAVRAMWPVHPAMTALMSSGKLKGFGFPHNFALCSPLPHAMLAQTLAGVRGVLTDSGGIVEEAATLGVPTAVLRNVTDRPEAEEAGIARRFAPTSEGVALAWNMLCKAEIARTPTDVYGDGNAALYVARHLAKVLK